MALREDFSPALFGGQEVDYELRELLRHGAKRGGIGIKYPSKSAERGHAMSVKACEALIESLLRGADLNCVCHWYCIRKASARARKARERGESAAMAEQKVGVGCQEQGSLERVLRSRAWLTSMPYQMNITEISGKDF